MNFLRLAKKNKEVDAKSWDELYEGMVIRKIRERYNVNQELSIIRQRDTKKDEFEEYNNFVEKCKREVKKELQR